MALEWVLEKIIMKTLGEYLNNDDQNKLRIGIQKGDTTLRKIELNVSAFNELDLPVHIKKVSIETLEIKIQLKNLRTQPITIKIKTVEVEAVPCENIGKSKQESEMSKDDKRGTSKKGKNKDSKKRSSSEKLLAAFIKNVNIELEDIHVHLDVAHTTSKELSTIGVRMKNFLFQTTDEKWRPCQVKTKLNNNFKLLEMKGLAVYWKCNNTDRGKAETSEATSQTSVKLDTTSTKADRKEKQTKNNTETFLIEPISCEAHLELNLKPGDIKHSRPVAFLQIELNKIGIQLSKRMYDDILLMVEHFEKLKSKNKGSPNANPLQHDKISSVPERQNSSDKKTESLADIFDKDFSEEEKKSLYEATGFQENENHEDLPMKYVDVRFEAKLRSFSFTLIAETKDTPPVLELQLSTANASVIKRTADNAVLFESNIGTLSVVGSPQNGITPKIVLPESEKEEDMLFVRLETNPLDIECGTRITVESQPLQIVYDLNTFVKVAAFLKPPSKAISEKISKTAIAKYAEVKVQIAKGLKHAMEQLDKMEIRIDLKSSCVFIPQGGFYKKNEVDMLVVCLGNMKVNKEKNQDKVQQLKINLDQVQLLYAKKGEKWESARLAGESPLHILLPISASLLLIKTVQRDNQQSAHLKVSATIQLLSIRLSHLRLQEILQLANSIIPTGEDESQKQKKKDTKLKSERDKERKSLQGTPTQVQAYIPSEIDMEITVKAEQVELVVMEGKIDPAANSLFLSMAVEVCMPKTHEMIASISNLQIASAIFSERDINKSQILDTCNISLSWKIRDEGSTEIEISTSDFILNISPPKIRTTIGIAANVSKVWNHVFKQETIPRSKKEEKSTQGTPSKVQAHLLSKSDLSIIVKVQKVEIVVMEDQSDPASNSLFLSMAVQVCMPKTHDIIASISNLQIASAIFSDRDLNKSQILDTCSISLSWQIRDGGLTEIKIYTSDFIFNISPQTIRTITGISVSISKVWNGVFKQEKADNDTSILKDPAGLWKTDDLVNQPFWFLRKDKTHVDVHSKEIKSDNNKEQLLIYLPSIVLNLQGGVGKRTVSLLIAEASFDAEVKNWSSKIIKNNDLPPLDDDRGEALSLLPKMSVNVKSSNPMEVTVTKTCLEVLNKLAKAFGDAYRLVAPAAEAFKSASPYVITNCTGMSIDLELDNVFEMSPELYDGKVTLKKNESLQLFERKQAKFQHQTSVIKSTHESYDKKISFQIRKIGDETAKRRITIKRSEKRLYSPHTGNTLAFVCSTETPIGQKIIHLSSIVQIKSNLPDAVEVLSCSGFTSDGVIQPGETFNVPVSTQYTNINLKPKTGDYETSQTSIYWRDAEQFQKRYVSCKGTKGQDYIICVKVEVIGVSLNETEEMSAKTYLFHLSPPIVIHNLLNITAKFLLKGNLAEISLEKGENKPVLNAVPGTSEIKVKIPNYLGLEWHGTQVITEKLPELSKCTFSPVGGFSKNVLILGIRCKEQDGCLDLSFYSPYWMINKTGMTLCYKGNDADDVTTHLPKNQVALFSFKTKSSVLQKKKVSLIIADTDWSDKFSLDTVGSSGNIQCKSKSNTYEVGVKIRLSSSGLTKLCTFTPLFMLLNASEVKISCAEWPKQEKWIEIGPKSCVPFWPVQSGKEKTMVAKVDGCKASTSPFFFNKPHTTLMRVDEIGGINVECQVTEAAVVTTLAAYKPGMASVLVINSTNKKSSLKYNQRGEKMTHELQSMKSAMYTWDNAIGKRELEWSFGKVKSNKNNLIEDGNGSFEFDSGTKIYWISFLDGLQRVLLFTDDTAVAEKANQAWELERIEQEINISIHSIGVSLVDDSTQIEVAYLCISSGLIWEEEKKKYKALNVKMAELLEAAHQKHDMERKLGHKPPDRVNLDSKTEVNFYEMKMIQPNNNRIRRSFQHGVWIQYKTSPHQLQVHAKINKLQLDNQTNSCVFPTVLASVPPPKSVASESVPKPFAEVSILAIKHEHSNMLQFKYIKVLVQEMSLKVDIGFLLNMHEFYKSHKKVSRDREKIMMQADLKTVQTELLEETGLSLAKEDTNFFDYLHLSPLKICVSFSLQGERENIHLHDDIINIALNSAGMVADFQDLIFKLSFIEKKNCFINRSQMISLLKCHYVKQALKQILVMVFGLDVLGNPLGFLRGMADGIEDLFYEPYQGAIQGPEEFAEGLLIGMKSLLGHTVGGAAGGVSRITGSIGKGLATLTFDDEYQKKRREALNKKPANIGEGLARGGKGIVMGFVDGATGIVRQPIQGAKKEGVEGFFKGIGKGLVGVVTRPTSGVVDFASSSFEGIKRIADLSDEVGRLRPPRLFYSDKIIRPYNRVEAFGNAILQETEKGKFARTDRYVAHLVIKGDSKTTKEVLLVTDRRVICAEKGDILGHWDDDWSHTYGDLKEKPTRSAKGVLILPKDAKKKFPLKIGSSSKKIEIPISDSNEAEWLVGKISEAMEKYLNQ